MPRSLPKHARHVAQSRLHRRTLLPLSTKAVDAMALKYHTALAALKVGRGTERCVELLLQLTTIARFIGEESTVRLDPVLLEELANVLRAAIERGHATGQWFIDAALQDLCAALVIEHERQLRVTPIGTLERALDRARHFVSAHRPAAL
ncbi:Fis family transcriptional regulator [Burkholderia glumae]|uniref:Fis family transcriptional regulator n=1 Tax=Burkholderia glumae TaxID=337 RepID=UPI0020CBC916|nr:Fis family transcriptional regulator [Burkholderia glumae]MCQ0034000.1 Fis family transcriptional regulator [Burkholderia glumae]MCQ0037482.1 Fis family transcriptional regulator [Burkholderia glumae]